MAGRRSLWPFLHPLLFAVWPVLFVYSECMDTVPFFRILRPAAIALAAAACLMVLVLWRAKEVERRTLALSFFLVWFASYGYVRFALPVRHRYLLPTWVVLLALVVLWLLRTRLDLRVLTRAANAGAVVLVLFSLGKIASYHVRLLWERQPSQASMDLPPPRSASLPLGYLPDIYYIILDSYTRSDVLKKRYGYDNSWFIGELERRGFYVAKESHSNYPATSLSIGSSLNMSHLTNAHAPVAVLVASNRVSAWLKSLGYTLVVFPSPWEAVEYLPRDVKLAGRPCMSQFECSLLHTSFWDGLGIALEAFGLALRPNTVRADTLFTLEVLPKVRRLVRTRPLFVFAHIMPPHTPFVFGKNGEDRSAQSDLAVQAAHRGSRQSFIEGYTAQVAFISARILDVIDSLLASSSNPPVIIVQGDHGPRGDVNLYDPRSVVWQEVYPILNAYRLPKHGNARLYDSITPVNSFRVVFDHCFGTDYGLLEDAAFFSIPGKPYDFMRIEPPGNENARPGF